MLDVFLTPATQYANAALYEMQAHPNGKGVAQK
jgi:hypothetical protein